MSQSELRERLVVGALLLAVVFAAKLPVLSTPYYWDETMWSGFAYSLSQMHLWEVLPGFHPVSVFRGRAPGLYVVTAILFKTFGTSIWLSHFVVACFAFIGVWMTYLLGRWLYGPWVGILAALWLFFDALYFAQSAMFLTDLPVTATGVSAVYFALRKRYLPYFLCALCTLSLKETGLAFVFAIALYVALTERGERGRPTPWQRLRYAAPLPVMGAYYTWQKIASGKFFLTSPHGFDFMNLTMSSAVTQFPFITRSLFVMQHRWVFTALIALALLFRMERAQRKGQALFLLIFLCSAYSFCFIVFLPRYLLPCAPYFFILAAWSLFRLVPGSRLRLLASAALVALSIRWLFQPELVGNGEWNMAYQTAVKVQAAACEYLEQQHSGACVLTVWPYVEYLRRPALGYVSRPLDVRNFRRGTDVKDGDLLLYCSPTDGSGRALESYARTRGLRLIKRFANGEAYCEVSEARHTQSESGSSIHDSSPT